MRALYSARSLHAADIAFSLQVANNNASTTSTAWSTDVPSATLTASNATRSGGRGRGRQRDMFWKEIAGAVSILTLHNAFCLLIHTVLCVHM